MFLVFLPPVITTLLSAAYIPLPLICRLLCPAQNKTPTLLDRRLKNYHMA